ncbi:pilus assembly protein TadG-related protein [Pseudomonas sp. DSV-1]|uniref:pilus assembly protein TadG-related protein n=1 Tax=Pseudomonas sp. DSV-1 TaxID=3112250 RepID=UPI002DB806D2|nr:pilus assembly protein TadG-related protein [Pseudomonas sp. DSV-1]MEC4241345.1 pilus assembly protein TadG-related protein [Pseudomonas sp. DSV-1]
MSPQLRGIGFTGPQQQRGAIGLMAAVTLGMVLLFMLLVVDSGRLYLEQRKLQRVADMAVLEAVSREGNCLDGSAKSYVDASAGRNGFALSNMQTITPTCGALTIGSDQVRLFNKNENGSGDFIQVIATTTVPTSVAGGLWSLFSKDGFETLTRLTASAVGASSGPTLAQLSIRSTLLKIDTDNSPLLSSVLSQMLGTSVTVEAVGWNGMLNTDINLLEYLNELSVVALNLEVGDYTKVLGANVTAAQLIQAAANVAENDKATAAVRAALENLASTAINIPGIKSINVAELFNIKTGTTSAGLDANVQLFQLIQAFVQAANKNSAITATVPINLLGLVKVTTQIKVIEPPQFSSVGNPALAIGKPINDINAIYVHTAQIRTLIAVELPLLKALSGLLSPITNLLKDIQCLISATCPVAISIIDNPVLHINLDVGGASALLTNYDCSLNKKSITVEAKSSIGELRIGQIVSPSTAFTDKEVKVRPLPLINVAIDKVPFAGGGVALSFDTPVGQTIQKNLTFSGQLSPPNLSLPPAEQHMKPTSDIVESLKKTLAGISIKIYSPANNQEIPRGFASSISTTLNTLLNLLTTIILPPIITLLGDILDPIINQILSLLGVNLMDTVVGANLSCNQGGRAQLVL